MTAHPFTKRAELEMNETFLVLFAVVILIIIGIFVYTRFSLQHVKSVSQQLTEQEASVLLAGISSLPEITCARENCIDTTKLIPFFQLSFYSSYYPRLLGDKKIIITQVYPVPSAPALCDLDHYTQLSYPDNCGSWVVYDHTEHTSHLAFISRPVSLYYPETNEYRIGRLQIGIPS